MNDPRRLAEVDPAWHTYQYLETGMEEFANTQPSVSTSRRGVKRRKDSSQIEAENARRSQAASGAVAPGHIGSDGFGHGMMIGPGAGVNPEDIHPQLDFTAFDHETVSSYLERNHAIPKFGFGSIHSVWDVNAKATDPRLLFIDEPEPIQTMLPGPGMAGTNLVPNTIQAGKGSNGKDASHQASPRDKEGRATKRRSTATSMVAAAIEESITMAEEEERKRKEKESDGQTAVQDATSSAARGSENPINPDATAALDGDGTDVKADDGQGENPDSPPTLRRSSRKPLPPGTSLAVTYRNTRSSPSPTPSFNSEDDVDPFVPILADIDMAKKVFAERAQRHWRDALAAGGGATVQGPGVNPAFAGQVMMGGTGGMMREGEVVAEFLYSTRVKNKALKVAAHNPMSETMGEVTAARR